MIIIERKFLFLKDKLIFFPSQAELNGLIKNLGRFDLLRIRETDAILPKTLKVLIGESEFKTSFIDLTKDLAELWKEMDKSSCRWEIRKAEKQKEKIEITVNQNPEVFLEIYNNFVKRKKHTSPLSKKRLNDYLKFSDFFLCYFVQEPVVGHLILKDEETKTVRLILSATFRLEGKEDAGATGSLNRYLHWYEFQYYKKQGFKFFDTGGVGSGKGGPGGFKLSLGGYKIKKKNYILGRSFVKKIFRIYILVKKLNLMFNLPL